MSIAPEDRNCTEKCKSVTHGDIITSALTKRSTSSLDLCTYLKYVCCCYESIRDSMGRTALHMAASCGRTHVVRWLLENHKQCNINAQDHESCYSALHRSIFCGKINVAIQLIGLGANINLLDADGYTILEHLMKDQKYKNFPEEGEIYVFGSNTNNTLGPQQARSVPELMDSFHREYPELSVNQMYLSKFHSVIIASNKQVFSCGHGLGGRLGLGIEKPVLVPKLVKFSSHSLSGPILCHQASIAQDHSLFLSNTGHIWACGLNTHSVLGIHPASSQLLVPRPLNLLQHPIRGICAQKYHSVAWGSKAIYTWGLHAGQLGHERSPQKYIVLPKIVPRFISEDCKIKTLASSVGAICCITTKGDVYVLHEYLCRKIAGRQLNVADLSIIGGTLDTTKDNTLSCDNYPLRILARTDNGNLLLWEECHPQLSRCIFSLNRLIVVRQATLNIKYIMFVTIDGEAFQGEVKEQKKKMANNVSQAKKSSFHSFLEKGDCRMVKITKLQRVHRAISIQSDFRGENYAVLQSSPLYFLSNFPQPSPSTFQNDMESFFENADTTDSVHDVVFKVKNCYFASHRCILASRSEKLKSMILNENTSTIELKDVEPDTFKQMLLFMYAGYCDLMNPFSMELKTESIADRENVKAGKTLNHLKLLNECAKFYQVPELVTALSSYTFHNGFIKINSCVIRNNTLKFDREQTLEFADVRIKTKNNKELLAHKCILAARMEYFNSMFSFRWDNNPKNTTEISLPFSKTVVEHLLEYLYTDSLLPIVKENIDTIFDLIILADSYFVSRLKEICECLLIDTINLRNVVQIFTFCNTYNAEQLKTCCMEFIGLNLAALMESGALNEIDELLLEDLTKYYCEWNPVMAQRIITPYSTAPSDQEIENIAAVYPLTKEPIGIRTNHKDKSSGKRRTRSNRQSKTSESKEMSDIEVKVEESQAQVDFEEPVTEEISPVLSRLRAIRLATDRIQNESVEDALVSFTDSNFPVLGSPPKGIICWKPSRADKSEMKGKSQGSKISQKQRKRLSSQNVEEELTTLAGSPKNPWKLSALEMDPVSSPNSFNTIIDTEKKQKEYLTKMRNKSLGDTQREDKAIEDLSKFYNVDNTFDEIICVERVRIDMTVTPIWVQKTK